MRHGIATCGGPDDATAPYIHGTDHEFCRGPFAAVIQTLKELDQPDAYRDYHCFAIHDGGNRRGAFKRRTSCLPTRSCRARSSFS